MHSSIAPRCFSVYLAATLLSAVALTGGSHAEETEAEAKPEATTEEKHWALKEYTTPAARVKAARDEAFQESLGGQAGLAREIGEMSSERLIQSDYSNTFPFFEYDLPPGSYTVYLKFTDAAYHNEFYVGVPKKIGGHYPFKEEFEVVHGLINNRDSCKPITFTLKVRSTIRFAAWSNRDSVGWKRSFMREKWQGNEIEYSIEDSDRPEHLDFDDLIIVFERGDVGGEENAGQAGDQSNGHVLPISPATPRDNSIAPLQSIPK